MVPCLSFMIKKIYNQKRLLIKNRAKNKEAKGWNLRQNWNSKNICLKSVYKEKFKKCEMIVFFLNFYIKSK